MSNSADYILPGHRDRIGDWPVAKLMSALEDMLYDNENGFLPPSVAESVEHLSKELFRRDSGAEEASAARRSALGRQLDAWFPATEVTLPALRGDDPTEAVADRFLARAASVYEALGAEREILDALVPANDRDPSPEMAWGAEADFEPEF